jgi:hypothetical protein
MTTKVHPIIAGSNAPMEVQFFDAATDAELVLTGCTGFSASAKHTDTGAVVNMDSVIVTSAALGKVKIEWAPGAFSAAGTYSLQITCTDSTGHTVILPSEAGQLLIRVGARIGS